MKRFTTRTALCLYLVLCGLSVTSAVSTNCRPQVCARCSPYDSESCLECVPGTRQVGTFNVRNRYACYFPNIANCVRYLTSGECSECPAFYTLYPDRCLSCRINNCVRCTVENVCDTCAYPYTVSEDGKACVPIISNCLRYDASGTCKQCNNQYTLSSDRRSCAQCTMANCVACSAHNVCSTCETNFVKSVSGSLCAKPINGCKTYSDGGTCTACESGYYLNGNHCVKCDLTRCSRCVQDNVCADCAAGYSFPVEGPQCVECNLDRCMKCSADNVCAFCEDGFGALDSKCSPCLIEGCLLCSANATVCDRIVAKDDTTAVNKGIPWWVWLIVGLGAAAILGVILFVVLWCCLRKPVVPVTVYEEDNYESEKDTDDNQTRDLALDFNNRSFFARPPPILIMNDYVQPRIYTQENTEVHGNLESAAADGESTSGSSDSFTSGDDGALTQSEGQ
ncbi:hypothetical protein, conserved [Angomonas deanei]|uniref:EGF-like domain-containing protein n=1 Tax=Angomonas deanei TaxID=59799 RepID=A0A7G2C161_9TRYP|nr:hypothetical protein, conserved [Angomonas deanei]